MSEAALAFLRKLAELVQYDFTDEQICETLSIDEEELAQLKGCDEFKIALAAVASEDFDKAKTLNDAYDTVEQMALGTIIETLEVSMNPDFALKAAMVANKAQRRGDKNNKRLSGQIGARTVINLSQSFIGKLQQMNVQPRGGKEIEQKQQDFLEPSKIESLLGIKKKENETQDLIPEFAVLAE